MVSLFNKKLVLSMSWEVIGFFGLSYNLINPEIIQAPESLYIYRGSLVVVDSSVDKNIYKGG
jgi:hypothetical protein